jgi:zinc transporter
MTNSLNWEHLDFSDPESARQIRQDSEIDEPVADALLDEESRPRAAHFDDGILVILRGVNLNPDSEAEDMVSIRLWLEDDRVVSTGRRRLRSVEAIRTAIEAGNGPATPGDFLVHLVQRLDDFMTDTIDDIEVSLEQAENQIQDSATITRNSPFSVLRRRVARIRRYLAPQREALDRLSRQPGTLLSELNRTELREEANRLTLILENLDLVRERAMVAQEEFLAILAHEQNERMLLLSIVAAIFLPLAFLTGLMGMNVAGLPGMENPMAFWLLCLGMLLIAALILVLFRMKKWV